MLVHGIMSSIAEFYSHNLATEVTKGIVQKAAAGGTPTKAPSAPPPPPLPQGHRLLRRASLQAHYAGALPWTCSRRARPPRPPARPRDRPPRRPRHNLRGGPHPPTRVPGVGRDCHSVYACGSDTTRRMANQAFFTRIYLDADDQITTEPPVLPAAARPLRPAPGAHLGQPAPERKEAPTPALASQDEGSSKTR